MIIKFTDSLVLSNVDIENLISSGIVADSYPEAFTQKSFHYLEVRSGVRVAVAEYCVVMLNEDALPGENKNHEPVRTKFWRSPKDASIIQHEFV